MILTRDNIPERELAPLSILLTISAILLGEHDPLVSMYITLLLNFADTLTAQVKQSCVLPEQDAPTTSVTSPEYTPELSISSKD